MAQKLAGKVMHITRTSSGIGKAPACHLDRHAEASMVGTYPATARTTGCWQSCWSFSLAS